MALFSKLLLVKVKGFVVMKVNLIFSTLLKGHILY